MQPTQSALIVPVPGAEPVVGRYRATLDASASRGVPAHVTVLFPFLPPTGLDEAVLATVRRVVATVDAFDLTLGHVDWFDERVVWLAPRPDEPFRTLITRLWHAFPQCPPYGGAHTEVVPHLTVGHDAPVPVLRAAAAAVAAHLPVSARVDAVHLITGSPDPNSWHLLTTFPLNPRPSP